MVTTMLLGVLAGCVQDVGKDKVAAEVTDAVEKRAEARGTAWEVDPSDSSIRALGAKITATHPIDFERFRGTITVDGDQVTAVAFTVDMDSLKSDNDRLTGHLKNEDFFDVPNHPTATFESNSVTAGGEGGATHTVSGNLTIRGTSKGVTFPATIAMGDGTVKASTEFTIDRQDFKVAYPGKPDDLVQDNVVLTVSLLARKR